MKFFCKFMSSKLIKFSKFSMYFDMRLVSRAFVRLLVELETSVSRTSGVPALQRVVDGRLTRNRERRVRVRRARASGTTLYVDAVATCRPALVAENLIHTLCTHNIVLFNINTFHYTYFSCSTYFKFFFLTYIKIGTKNNVY